MMRERDERKQTVEFRNFFVYDMVDFREYMKSHYKADEYFEDFSNRLNKYNNEFGFGELMSDTKIRFYSAEYNSEKYYKIKSSEESAALTMWNGTDDIGLQMAVSSEFNVLTIDPRLLSPENGQRIIDGIYREISARNYIKNLSSIIIDKSGITEDTAYYFGDKFRIGLADNFEKYFLKITEFYVMKKKDIPSTVHCLDDVVYYFDFGHGTEEFCAKIFVLNDT